LQGWGREGDTLAVMEEMGKLGVDTSMTLGDRDFALCAHRASRLAAGERLSSITTDLASRFGIDDVTLIPASDDPIETHVQVDDGSWLDFQTYFVDRGHADAVSAIAFHGTVEADPAPGVIEAIDAADIVVIAPSNPPLSIWPILAIDPIAALIGAHPRVAAVSPLFAGKPVKGPADAVMAGIGLAEGTEGILEAYDGLIDVLFIDSGDRADVTRAATSETDLVAANTWLDEDNGPRFAAMLLEYMAR
ncbi:MAG: 2-phospho-L-lactate transferase, partial [Armatimonadetes bacterium]